MPKVDRLFSLLLAILDPLLDALRFIRLSENLFLRKQLALYLERQVEPRLVASFLRSRHCSCRGSL
jgi:hypothetical protein